MRLDHTVRVPADVDEVWKFLDDIHAVASCMPGAELTETVDDATYRGWVKVAIGPLSMNYAGEVAVVERDQAARRLRLNASGRDRRGSGTAQAGIEVSLDPDGAATTMRVLSDVKLTGRVAALGRGVQDVSNKLFAEFADGVAARLGNGASTAAAVPTATPTATVPPATEAPALSHPPRRAATDSASIKLAPLVWSVTRERLANLLQRLSDRVRP